MASLNAHNALIEHALQLNNGIADASGRVVDPSLDSYYLVGTATTAMPDILERVGKLGAAGMTVLTRGGTVTDSVRQDFTRDLGGLDKIKAELVAGVARAGKYNEAIKPRLEEFQQKFSGGVAEVVAVVDNEIVSGNLRSSAGSFLAQAAVRAHQRRIAAAERSGSRDGGRHRTIDRRHQPDCRVRTRRARDVDRGGTTVRPGQRHRQSNGRGNAGNRRHRRAGGRTHRKPWAAIGRHFRDRERDQGNRRPDQSARPQCRYRGRAGRRTGPRLRRRRRRGAGAARVVHSINDISLALKEQGAASNEIAGNVERIAQMADENHAAITQTTSTAQQLERLAVALQDEVRRYRVSPVA